MLHTLPIRAFEDNYLWLAYDDAGNAVVVDPGDADPVLAVLRARGLNLRAIVLTHHHADHIGGVASLRAHAEVPVYAPVDERITEATVRVGDGDVVVLPAPSLRLQVMATPGHTRSHICYFDGERLFCGDTLFSVGCGRLFEGTPAQMLTSLDALAALPAATTVHCAHEYTLSNCAFARTIEPANVALQQRIHVVHQLRQRDEPSLPSTIGQERATNPFLRIDADAVIAWGLREHAIARNDRVERFAALRRAKDQFRVPAP